MFSIRFLAVLFSGAVIVGGILVYRNEKPRGVHDESHIRTRTEVDDAHPHLPIVEATSQKEATQETARVEIPLIPAQWEKVDRDGLEAIRAKVLQEIDALGAASDQSLQRAAIIADSLRALNELLVANPIRPISANISPPLYRPDGTRYSNQGVSSGMDPSAIRNAEQRKAYEEMLLGRAKSGEKQDWIVKAQGSRNLLIAALDRRLDQLIGQARITPADKERIMQTAGCKEIGDKK